MTELLKPEKQPAPEKKLFINQLKKIIEDFLAKSDEPGPILSEEEEFQLSKRAGKDPEALKEWNKHKLETKYRRNALGNPLIAAKLFLESDEAENIPAAEKKELLARVEAAEKYITEVGVKPFTKSDVQLVIDLVNDLKKYL